MRLVSHPTYGRIGIIVLAALFAISITAVSASAMTNHPKIEDGLEQILSVADSDVLLVGPYKQLYGRGADDTVQVVIVADDVDDLSSLSQSLLGLNAHIQHIVDRHIQAIVPIEAIETLASRDEVAFVRFPIVPKRDQIARSMGARAGAVTSEGLRVIGASTWHAAELDGAHVKVGIIDDFDGYEALLGSELPSRSRVITRSFYGDNEMYDSDSPSGHGTGVAEIIHDVAPGATLYLVAAGTDVEVKEAIAWLVNQDVDVINTSWGFYSGCFRGGGIFEPDIQQARRKGITWATAAGNEADIHWTGAWTDPDGDNHHNFASTDEGLTLEIELEEYEYSDGTRVAHSLVFGNYSWDAPCTGAGNDYEVVVAKEVNGRLQPLPTYENGNGQETDWYWEPGRPIKYYFAREEFPVARAGSTETYHLVLRKTQSSVSDARVDVLLNSCDVVRCAHREYIEARSSVGVNEPSISANAFSVGAIHHSTSCPRNICPDGRLVFYSSQGPTLDGRRKPDIAAPAHVSSVTYGEFADDEWGFGGTSAAAPHVAGAAALVLSAFPHYAPDDVIDFLQNRAEDLGPSGPDDQYGYGLLTLGPVPTQAQPSIERIEPSEGTVGSTVEARIVGTNLQEISSVTFSGDGVTAIIRGGVTSTTLPITISIASDASTGTRTFWVSSPRGRIHSDGVTFRILPRPQLSVSPNQLTFSVTSGGAAPRVQTLSIRSGSTSVAWNALATAPWIGLGSSSGRTPTTLTVAVDPTDLAPGEYGGRIVVTATGAAGSPAMVNVTFIVQPAEEPPELTVSPDPPDLDFGELERGLTVSRALTIENTGGGTLNWNASSTAPWVSLNPSTGVLQSDQSVDINAQINTEGLAVGIHEASLMISSDVGSKRGTIRVQVTESPPTETMVALVFLKLEFLRPADWDRTIDGDMIVYTNISLSSSPIRVTLPDETELEFDVPPDRRVIVDDHVVHIDTRPQ